ncbi:cellulase family glycosylhydrolase [Glycomyces sp. A-F 0318]|uniref:cellulase family glycosylhydrolase n=1 Tax=Glycomyces amatae TaxID=2881355 RepID=UPI001E312F95|nr:cellulase family glycosylhydrolase [Glycomyces amatae]MCD0447323.1 cellulase family glycosylhydrolase [Glycomyces amatae]
MATAASTRPRRSARRLLLAAITAVALAAGGLFFLAPAQAQANGFHVVGSNLVDANGNEFIMRGSTHPYEWYQTQDDAIGDMSALGTNTVRVVLGSGQQWGPSPAANVAGIIDDCKANRVVCVLEVHDTTGYADASAPNAASLDQAVDYWISIQDVLEGEEAYVIINIGNEPWGNENVAGWEPAMTNAIERMRAAGFEHTLIADAPNWGQDWTNTMRDGDTAQRVFDADPLANTVFSVHMYSVYAQPQTVIDYFDAFEAKGLPLIVGEFGEDTPTAIEAEAQERGIGWIAWSWSGNTGGTHDQVIDFDPNQMRPWGERVFHGENGIGATAERASVFGDDPDPTDPTTTPDDPTTEPEPEGDCSAEIEVAGDWGSGWQGNVSITADAAVDGWTLTWTWPGATTVTSHWNAELSQSGATVTASDVGWNAAVAAGQTRQVFGFIGSSAAATPEVTCTAA